MVQVVNATTASYNDVALDKDDTINIMFQSIMKEMQEMKKNNFSYGDKSIPKRAFVQIKVENEYKYTEKEIKEIVSGMKEIVKYVMFSVEKIDEDIIDIAFLFNNIDFYYRNRDYIRSCLQSSVGRVLS